MKKKLKIIITVLLGIAALIGIWTLGVNTYVKGVTKERIISLDKAKELENIDCIIVLGCLVRPDGSPSGMLEDRLVTAVDLWNNGVSPTLLMSGDHGEKDYDEVNTMRDFAVGSGVPVERVFMDHAGFCTYDSIYRLKEIFGAKRAVIVTQEYHLHRALYIADKLGIEAWGVSADIHSYRGQTARDVREIVARNKDFLTTAFKIKPKYLGDSIDLSGDGRVTEG